MKPFVLGLVQAERSATKKDLSDGESFFKVVQWMDGSKSECTHVRSRLCPPSLPSSAFACLPGVVARSDEDRAKEERTVGERIGYWSAWDDRGVV